MRLVADTNTVVSGLLWQGAPRRLVDLGRAGRITLVTSPPLLAELAEVVARDKFSKRIVAAELNAKTLVENYALIAQVIDPAPLSSPVCRDPDDDQVIACALAAHADAIVSGNDDLLSLLSHRGITMLTVQQALESIKGTG